MLFQKGVTVRAVKPELEGMLFFPGCVPERRRGRIRKAFLRERYVCSRAYAGRFNRRGPYFVAVHREEARPGGTEWAWLPGWAGCLDPGDRKARPIERAAADWAARGATEWAGRLAGWAGWLGLQRCPKVVPESSVPFGRGPRCCGLRGFTSWYRSEPTRERGPVLPPRWYRHRFHSCGSPDQTSSYSSSPFPPDNLPSLHS